MSLSPGPRPTAHAGGDADGTGRTRLVAGVDPWPELARHTQDNGRSALSWTPAAPVRAIATTVLGGGIGERAWVLNAEVELDYHHGDPTAHAAAIAAELGMPAGDGIGFLTAARVQEVATAVDGGARCDATVGISVPTWAAADDGAWSQWVPGTINLVCWVPAPLSDAALVNAVITVTEAKTQALLDAGVPGTGTASDAVAICCPLGGTEPYGGPRSVWGARLARAVHAAVAEGTGRYLGVGRPPRPAAADGTPSSQVGGMGTPRAEVGAANQAGAEAVEGLGGTAMPSVEVGAPNQAGAEAVAGVGGTAMPRAEVGAPNHAGGEAGDGVGGTVSPRVEVGAPNQLDGARPGAQA
jgi:adenosylcobinamide amidohydrolase